MQIRAIGSQLSNPDSAAKLRLGLEWEKATKSSMYKYLMLFDKNAIEGAFNLEDGISRIKQM